MSSDHGGGAGSILMAFVCGAIAGAAVALLYTPATGDEARDFLSQRAREGREKASEAAREGRETLRRQREQLASTLEKAKETYRTVRQAEPEEGA